MRVNNQATMGISNKDLLLGAALGEFSERGFSGATLESIAKSAGLNVRLVYHYFGNKADLYTATLASVLGDLKKVLDGIPVLKMTVDESSLKDLFSQLYRWMLNRPQASKLLVSEVVAGGQGLAKLKEKSPELFEPLFDRALALFRAFLGSNRPQEDDDSIWILAGAGMTSFLAAGFGVTKLFLGDKFAGPERWEESLYRALRRVIGNKEN